MACRCWQLHAFSIAFMKISFYTLGCKLNQAETDELKTELKKIGAVVVPFSRRADVAIVRACGVTCGASATTREMIRHAKKRGAYVIATGCLESNIPEIDFAAKNNEEITEHVARLAKKVFIRETDFCEEPAHRTRAFVKIQNGCNFNCAYCIIPHFRGRSQSVPGEDVINSINEKVAAGYREAVLTGVNINQYRDKNLDLAGLIKKILLNTKIVRLRLGSLDPRLITPELIKLYSNKKFARRLMPHWHLSLQSGSDEILKKMKRPYTAQQYLNIVAKLRGANPLFSFTTDAIVGFPGETGTDFARTCDVVAEAVYAKVHVFPFSPRPGTVAGKMKPVRDQIKTERSKKLIRLSKKIASEFAARFVGKTRPVLFENKNTGYTPEFIRVKTKKKFPPNTIADVKITKSNLQL